MFIQALNGALGIIAVMFTGVLGLDLGGVTYGMIIVGIFIVTILMYFFRRMLMMPEYDPDEPYFKEKAKKESSSHIGRRRVERVTNYNPYPTKNMSNSEEQSLRDALARIK